MLRTLYGFSFVTLIVGFTVLIVIVVYFSVFFSTSAGS